ncbi:hypothetical protein HW532_03830 [Kaustia mangrovi]|uniref:histidine kinase n=1 Tax=Kaustia mangrovi TaxID=2593653 RepID=A0A7S8HAT4_9HYPH|nr:ATP-binding protein [Kaustia mangrovi]QPC41922.1 hypothetical protein HW532_03830 [Kaustia mangrovi]
MSTFEADPETPIFAAGRAERTRARATSLPLALPMLAAAAAPVALAVAVRWTLTGEPLDLGLAALVALGWTGLLWLALHHRRTAATMQAARADRDAAIETLKREKADAEAARLKAEQDSHAKSRFLAAMSHELRTPLNAILGFSDVLRNEMFGPINTSNYKDYAADIHTSGQHLLSLVNDILDLSRIEAGHYELAEEPVSLPRIARDCRHLLDMKAGERGIEIVETYEPALPLVMGDERAIRQICLNLLSNAVKFAPDGGEVVLFARLNALGAPVFGVRDDGPGIPEDEIDTVLSAFGQAASASPEHRRSGFGLGLPIVQGLAALHDGRLRIDSKPGQGTEARVELPLRRTLAAHIRDVHAQSKPMDTRQHLVALTA